MRVLTSPRMSLPLAAALTFASGAASAAAVKKADVAPTQEERDKATVCTDGKSHYIVILPDPHLTWRLLYGDGKRLVVVPGPPERSISGESFLDPRRLNPTANPNFRGVDVRLFSSVDVPDKEKGKGCAVTCGEKRTELQTLEPQKARDLLAAARYEPNPQKWRPYALARDNRAIYYYVDQGTGPGEDGNFRLFVGAKGNLKQQKMTNVAKDSGGAIFATKTGSLRLVLDQQQSTWIQGERETNLRALPVTENMPMIYNELGVYTGARLGTPCDDF